MAPLLNGNIIAGKYRLDALLARGGMGEIWRGRHLPLEIDVAIKILKGEQAASPEWRARFQREAKAAAKLKIPHVVQVYDHGLEGDIPYLVMELLEGEDLAEKLRREERLSIAATVRVVDQVSQALSRAHVAGLVHRDLKPANIFLAQQGDAEIVKVLDFGIAKVTGRAATDGSMSMDAATETGMLLGSPHYMSPEQVRNSKQVDHRSDLWSLGVIIFRCVTGKLPFPGKEIGEVLVDVCTAPVPLPSEITGDISPALDAFIHRALARDPETRFQSAGELASALADVAAGIGPSSISVFSGVTGASMAQAKSAELGPREFPSAATAAPWVKPGRSTDPPRRVLVLGALLAVAVGAVVSLLVFSQRRHPAEGAASPAMESASALPPPSAASSSAAAPKALAPPPEALPSGAASNATAPSGQPSAVAPSSPKRPKISPAPAPPAARPPPSRKPHDPLNEM